MKFMIGDKVKIREEAIRKFSFYLINRTKKGGVIADTSMSKAFPLVDFGNYTNYYMWYGDLELIKSTKGQQGVFEFMM